MMKVAIISQKSHCKPHKQALKSLGFKVMELGGSPTSIPRSIHFAILRTDSCSHGASDVALAWKRRSPETRVLAFANGVTTIKEAAQHYLDTHQPPPPKAEPPKRAPKPRRRRVVAPPIVVKDEPMSTHPRAATFHSRIDALPGKPRFIHDFIHSSGNIGCGTEDIRAEWHKVFGRVAAKSTVATHIARLKDEGLIYNVGGQGRNEKGRKGGPKAAWYFSHAYRGRSMKHNVVCRAYDEYVARVKAERKAARQAKKDAPYEQEAEAKLAKARKSLEAQVSRETAAKVAVLPPIRVRKSEPPAVKPKPKPKPAPKSPTEGVREEVELLVLWMREWNIESITLSRSGEVTLSDAPTKEPELSVWFITPGFPAKRSK